MEKQNQLFQENSTDIRQPKRIIKNLQLPRITPRTTAENLNKQE